MTTRVDYLAVGAGPAGLRLGYFLRRSGRDHLILESGTTPGTYFRTFSRHRNLISINRPYTGQLFAKYGNRYFPDADEVTKDLRYGRVNVCTGFRSDDSIFSAGVENDWTGPTAHRDPLRAVLNGGLHPVALPATTAG